MRKRVVICAFAATLCLAALAPAAAFGVETPLQAGGVLTTAESEAVDQVDVFVQSSADLLAAIDDARKNASADTPYYITLVPTQDGYSVAAEKRIPAYTTIDLNGQTVTSSANYVFALRGKDSSVINGTLKGTGIRVDVDDSNGTISKLKVLDAPKDGIYVCASGVIGSIQGNTVKNPARAGILIQSGEVVGNISGNTISGQKSAEDSSIYLINGGKVGGKIAKNTITNGKGHGIRLFSRSICGNIEYNNVSKVNGCAIQLTAAATAKKNEGCEAGDIARNTLKNIGADGVSIYHGSHTGKVTYNKIDTVGLMKNADGDFGITINAGSPYKTYVASITHNTVSNVPYASIVVFSGPEGDTTGKRQDFGHIEGDISYNTINNNATLSKGEKWLDGKDKKPCEGAIYVDSHARVFGSIHHNTINTSYDDGINILAYSSVKSIHHNTINNAKFAGIAVCNRSTVYSGVYNNTIKNPSFYGIFVNTSSAVKGRLSSNTITTPGVNGIFVTQNSSAVTVASNKITGAKQYGIICAGKSKIKTVSGNTVSVNKAADGFGIFSNAGCLITTIEGNTIKGKYSAGVRVKDPTGKTSVLSNTMTVSGKAKSFGISVDGCKAKTITINSNKIVGNNTAAGIFLRNSAAVAKGNKISKSTKAIVVVGNYKVRS